MKIIVCKHCGVKLEVDDSVSQFNCPNCGKPIHLSHTPSSKELAALIAILLIIVASSISVWILIGNKTSQSFENTQNRIIKIEMPVSAKEAKGMNYEILVDSLRTAGFTDIKLIEDPDIRIPIIGRAEDGKVKKISIQELNSGKALTSFDKGQKFLNNSEITITYSVVKGGNKK